MIGVLSYVFIQPSEVRILIIAAIQVILTLFF
jgi:hypothetical protein